MQAIIRSHYVYAAISIASAVLMVDASAGFLVITSLIGVGFAIFTDVRKNEVDDEPN